MSILFLLTSCDPDVPGEAINLPLITFPIKISPDTTYIKLGDTLILKSSISNVLDDGTIIKDGKAAIGGVIGYSDETPIISSLNSSSIEEYIYIIPMLGGYDLNVGGGLGNYYAFPNGDFIEIEMKIVPKKVGTYNFSISSLFFEGSQGKARTNPYFDITDNHGEELLQIPGMNALTPDNPNYQTLYYFAVYE